MALARFQIDLQGMRTRVTRLFDEARRRVDMAKGADADEQLALLQRVVDALHVIGHLAEPDDIRAQRTDQPAAGARLADRHVIL